MRPAVKKTIFWAPFVAFPFALTLFLVNEAGAQNVRPAKMSETGTATYDALRVGNGTAADPSVQVGDPAQKSGLFYQSTGILSVSTQSTRRAYFMAAGFGLLGLPLTIFGNGAGAGSLATTLWSPADATLQLGGANAASPGAQTLKVQDCTGSNCNGATAFTFKAPAGRGTGTRGKFVFQTPQVAASGDNAQTQTDRLSIAEVEVTTNIGTGTAVARVGGVLHVSTTSQATTGTSEEVLATYTLPANTLARDGQAIRVTAVYTTAANANTKTGRLRIGGIAGTALVGRGAGDNGSTVKLTSIIVRTGSNAQAHQSGYGLAAGTSEAFGTLTVTDSAANDIVVTGTTATSAGDMTFKMLIVEALN